MVKNNNNGARFMPRPDGSVAAMSYGGSALPLTCHAPLGVFAAFIAVLAAKANGMGVGLAVCRSIAGSQGGTRSASSGVPYSAVLDLVLPRSR